MDQQSEVIALLSTPATYGADVTRVERLDTHISSVFIAGERVYKLKRAVRLPFLDFSGLDNRHHACLAELAVNRRTAPALYLGVTPITRQEDGSLSLGGEGPAVDWVVVMRRFDQEDLLDRLAESGGLTRELVLALTDAVAELHRSAEKKPQWGGERGLRRTIDSNAECFAEDMPAIFDPGLAGHVTEGSLAWLARLDGLLEARRRGGFVRLCHGDLHLGNICLFEGRPTLFDAIEFNQDFACIDVFYDLAFLLMDLVARRLPEMANWVLNRYLERTGDFDGVAALPLFLSLRAAIRAHVAAATARHASRPSARPASLGPAGYLRMAAGFLEPPPPRLVAVGGLSGSGKSRLARGVAPLVGPAPGAVVLRTDVLRKQLAGVSVETRLPPSAYGAEMTERTYGALYRQAEQLLRAGHAVVADAVFARPDQRDAIALVAERLGVPFAGLWLEAEPELMRSRIRDRTANASDATVEVLDQQMTYALGSIAWPHIDSSGSKAQTLALACEQLGVTSPEIAKN